MKGWLIALMAAMLGGCFSPTYPEGLACTASKSCPSDLVCKFDQCVKAGTDNTPDAMPPCEPNAGMKTFEAGVEAIEDWQIPTCISSLTITVAGASGGGTGMGASKGWGAIQRGEFLIGELVHEGDILRVLVGKSGLDATDTSGSPGPDSGASGGGGSFVVAANGEPLIVSGGGGGATYKEQDPFYDYGGGFEAPMAAGENGGGTNPGLGGVDGNGGMTASIGAFHAGTGGGGFKTDGTGDSTGEAANGTPNKPGTGFANGGAGGVPGTRGRAGGYGGGGVGGATGGGGGGYGGGGSGGTPTSDTVRAGGVGGSVNFGKSQAEVNWNEVGHGSVVIQWNP